mmetsp:Transcript_12413/g.35908  ORF Transcript_12413/g.35908 Transcript_12413/m.35908 type:complete len:229 (-) Transcript_12413:31-717(-)
MDKVLTDLLVVEVVVRVLCFVDGTEELIQGVHVRRHVGCSFLDSLLAPILNFICIPPRRQAVPGRRCVESRRDEGVGVLPIAKVLVELAGHREVPSRREGQRAELGHGGRREALDGAERGGLGTVLAVLIDVPRAGRPVRPIHEALLQVVLVEVDLRMLRDRGGGIVARDDGTCSLFTSQESQDDPEPTRRRTTHDRGRHCAGALPASRPESRKGVLATCTGCCESAK